MLPIRIASRCADTASNDPDFAAGKKALVAEDWNGAIAALKLAALRDPRALFEFGTVATSISELFGPFEKPPLAALPFFLGR